VLQNVIRNGQSRTGGDELVDPNPKLGRQRREPEHFVVDCVLVLWFVDPGCAELRLLVWSLNLNSPSAQPIWEFNNSHLYS